MEDLEMRSVSILLGALLAPGCSSDRTCNPIGCEEGVAISVISAVTIPDGSYELAIGTGGTTIQCHRTAPDDGQEPLDCDSSSRVFVQPLIEGAQVGFLIRIFDLPERVVVTVRHEGTTVASSNFRPDYRTTRLGRGACTERCEYAEEEVPLSFGPPPTTE
jgi:hypothetical protein